MERSSERAWLRYAVSRTAGPGWWTISSLCFGLTALGDYVFAYLTGHITALNVFFCILGILSIVIGATTYRWEQAELLKAARKKIENTLAIPFAYSRPIGLRQDYVESGYAIIVGKHGKGFWSPRLSKLLFEKALMGKLGGKLVLRAGSFEGVRALRRGIGAKAAINALRANKHFENDKKIRLCSDILLDAGASRAVEIQKTDYLASRVSNDISFQCIEEREVGLDHDKEARTEQRYDGLSFFTSDTRDAKVFRGYTSSDCSNQLGISTLALTADGYLLLVDQLDGGLESPGLLAPSGSGSLDWSDLPGDLSDVDFWSWLIEASKRELREELGLAHEKLTLWQKFANRKTIAKMKSVQVVSAPIGFGGFLHRGGKPDFFFFAKLSCTLDDIREHSIYAHEERFLSQRCEVKSENRLEARHAAALLELLRRCATTRDSFPLEMGSSMLSELCKSSPKAIKKFLNN